MKPSLTVDLGLVVVNFSSWFKSFNLSGDCSVFFKASSALRTVYRAHGSTSVEKLEGAGEVSKVEPKI